MNAELRSRFENLAETWLPRILTHMDRDPTSSTYGCADRNWWHYKIRDFPSIILQQAGYAAAVAATFPSSSARCEGLHAVAAASCRFWAKRAVRRGAFEEYYPWEQGYPPLAFSTLAVMKMAATGEVESRELRGGALVAARQLCARFEHQAANQQVAGLAGLLWLRRVFPDLVTADQAEQMTVRSLALQHEEGWYEEYGGPDLGYLSVTIDCLWDCHDATGDMRFVRSAEKALVYIDAMTAWSGTNMGMHNARNTDYIVPYGIARFAAEGEPLSRETGRRLLLRLYHAIGSAGHFLTPTDDRYLCHYIGHSLFRAVGTLRAMGDVAVVPEPAMAPRLFAGSGHVLMNRGILSLKKGGIFSLRGDRGVFLSDFGWSVPVPEGRLVTHWWSEQWKSEPVENGWRIAGRLVPCREHLSAPWKHAILRLVSFVLGRTLIARLKKTLIFKAAMSPYPYERTVRFVSGRVEVEDRIQGLASGLEPEPAPRASRRHVASADSSHFEDFTTRTPGWVCDRSIRREDRLWVAKTIYTLEAARENREECPS